MSEVRLADIVELFHNSSDVVARVPREFLHPLQSIKTVSSEFFRFGRAAEAEKARCEGGPGNPGVRVLVAEDGFEHSDALAQNRLGLRVLLMFNEKPPET